MLLTVEVGLYLFCDINLQFILQLLVKQWGQNVCIKKSLQYPFFSIGHILLKFENIDKLLSEKICSETN